MARDRYEDEDADQDDGNPIHSTRRQEMRPARRPSEQQRTKQGFSVLKIIAIVFGSTVLLAAVVCSGAMLYLKKVKEDIEALAQTRKKASDSSLSVFQLLRGQHQHVYFNSTEDFKKKYSSEQFDELLADEPLLKNHLVATEDDPRAMPTGIAPNRSYTTSFEISDDKRLLPYLHADRPENGWPEVNIRKVTVVMKESADGLWNLDQLLLKPK